MFGESIIITKASEFIRQSITEQFNEKIKDTKDTEIIKNIIQSTSSIVSKTKT